MSYHNHPGPIPNRWLYCPRNGSGFMAEKFLPFKTPLSSKFTSQMPVECQFQPEMVFSFAKMKRAKIGLWIDLTNTSRFYDRNEVESRGAQYRKMQCRGHGETPNAEQTHSFIEMVESFITQSPLDMIGVHCTHGFNRTGFLIVSYMVERLDCSVEAALMEFARVRPPGIYKDDYIKELFRRYGDEQDATEAPPLPAWCDDTPPDDHQAMSNAQTSRKRSHTDRSNGPPQIVGSTGDEDDDIVGTDDGTEQPDDDSAESAGSTSAEGVPKFKRRKKAMNLKGTFMEGIRGVNVVTDKKKAEQLQDTLLKLCPFESTGFPGLQPVSMDLDNMTLLHKKPYRVSWKADGTRYMMLIMGEDEVYFFDRDNACFKVDGLRFLHSSNNGRHLTNTVLDGEMVIDKENGLSVPRYLVYDIVHFEKYKLAASPFYPNRLSCINNEIIEPRYLAMKTRLIKKELEPFSVRLKGFWNVTEAEYLLSDKFTKALTHEPDGLIFQPSSEPYVCGPCPEVLKWKPADMNSVDFKLKIVVEDGIGIVKSKIGHLYVGGHDLPVDTIKYTKILKDLDEKIIECKVENGRWVLMRERTDKSFPNSFATAKAVMQSIKAPVTKQILSDFIRDHRYKERDDEKMPPPRAPANQVHPQ